MRNGTVKVLRQVFPTLTFIGVLMLIGAAISYTTSVSTERQETIEHFEQELRSLEGGEILMTQTGSLYLVVGPTTPETHEILIRETNGATSTMDVSFLSPNMTHVYRKQEDGAAYNHKAVTFVQRLAGRDSE